jgi:dipeptidyl aminopeptidase/acylaminoacyl peptidase
MLKRAKLRIIMAIILMVIVGVYLLITRFAYDVLTLPIGNPGTDVPIGQYQDVSFTARGRNYSVHAFYLPGNPDAPALISIPGYRGNRHDSYHMDRALALRSLGYNVLSLDLSADGGDTVGSGRISMGYSERWDVLGGFDYLMTQGFAPHRIGFVGSSMGAATALLAAAAEPRVKAIWADSAYTRSEVAIGEWLHQSGTPTIIIPGGMLWGLALTGDHLWEAAPIEVAHALAANKQVIYLVHGEKDSVVLFHHAIELVAAYKAAGVQFTFWDIPNLEHVQGIIDKRDEYLGRLDTFFQRHLAWTM